MKVGSSPAFFICDAAMEKESNMLLIDRVTALITPVLVEMAAELIEAQFRREGHGWVLRLIIDTEAGVTLDDCARVSREAGNLLEIEELITYPYHLEVSSPGLDRPLRNEKDFRRFVGRLAKVKTSEAINGQQVFIGRLGPVNDDAIAMTIEQGEVVIPFALIAKARLEVEF